VYSALVTILQHPRTTTVLHAPAVQSACRTVAAKHVSLKLAAVCWMCRAHKKQML
jgi:hypothetical protein